MKQDRLPVFLVDDDEVALTYYQTVLQYYGVATRSCLDSREVMSKVAESGCSVMLLDLNMPYVSGQELLKAVKSDFPYVNVIVITSEDVVETAVECMRLGAFDYLTKPVDKNRLWTVVQHALELVGLRQELQQLNRQFMSKEIHHPEAFADIITGSDKLLAIFSYIEAIASSPKPVLITGESGTGKELVARVIHRLSGYTGDFVAVNVSGLDDTVFSDTLFGHAKGAFTGAEQKRRGLVVAAAGGTLFLDEIGDLEQSSQIKLLRLLQEQEYYPLGTDTVQKSNARIIAATNADLVAGQGAGTFRKDLFFRLMAHHIDIPPLRERMEDLPLLIDHFLQEAAVSLEKTIPTVPRELHTLLRTHSFPGNIRELQSLLYDALSRHESGILSLKPFRAYLDRHREQPAGVADSPVSAGPGIHYSEPFPTLKEVEAFFIEEALRIAEGNQSIAARLLGVNQSTLSRRLKG